MKKNRIVSVFSSLNALEISATTKPFLLAQSTKQNRKDKKFNSENEWWQEYRIIYNSYILES